MRKLLVTGLAVLLLGFAVLWLFIGGGFVAGDPGLIAVEVQAAEHQDSHFSYYQEHLARTQMSSVYCR